MNKNLILLSLLWLLAPGSWQSPQNKQQPKSLVINRVTVIDATGAEAKSDMTVVITGDRITTIGKAAEVKIPKDAQVIEAAGKDQVLLDANPLAEITNTQKINAVVTGGRLIDKAAFQATLAQAEAAAKRQ